MARSHKKTPVCGNAGGSEKWDKRINNRMFRHREKICIVSERYNDIPLNMNEVRSTWDMNKDGKSWVGYMKTEIYFNPWTDEIDEDYYSDSYKKLMRK